jgi:hypothetical protein
MQPNQNFKPNPDGVGMFEILEEKRKAKPKLLPQGKTRQACTL